MTVFNVIEKRQKSRYLLSGFLQKSSLQNQKSTFTVKCSPCSSLEVTFSVLISFPGRDKAFCSNASWPCLDLQHHDCIACWEIAKIFDGVRSFPNFFHIYTKSTATPSSYHGNSALVVIFSGRKFQNMPWRVKKFISSRVPKRLRFGAAIFPVPRAISQIRKRST